MATADCCAILGPAIVPLLVLPRADVGLLMQLLLKASSNDKKFVVEEARTCLDRLAVAAGLEALLEGGGVLVDHKSPKVGMRVWRVCVPCGERNAIIGSTHICPGV